MAVTSDHLLNNKIILVSILRAIVTFQKALFHNYIMKMIEAILESSWIALKTKKHVNN